MCYGVGIYKYDLPFEFKEFEDTCILDSPNYGNYIYTDSRGFESVLVFIPKFWVYTSDDRESIDIIFDGPKDNYILHRSFIDGGEEKSGFFIDKYIASKTPDNQSCRSIYGGVPISLTNDNAFTASYDMLDCKGTLEDSIIIANSRGIGFNVPSAFQYDALVKLAWMNVQSPEIKEYWKLKDTGLIGLPRGCNHYLTDYYDSDVKYESAGDVGDVHKPKTGAISGIEKTSHNGHLCGVLDLNGTMLQCALGITTFENASIAYVLKPSFKLSELTSPWDSKDPYDLVEGFFDVS